MHRLTREDFFGQLVYCASDFSKRKEQMLHRRTCGTAEALPFSRDALAETSDDTKAAMILFLSTLDERQRRLYAGLECLRLGHGGDCRIAERTGLDVHTIISIDTKKKEMLGRVKNADTTWEREPVLVNDHDFKQDACTVAELWGLFEPTASRGHVIVGTSHDTPTFPVAALARWWMRMGKPCYPQARRLLILADGGGSNGPRNRAWLHKLQTRFCNRIPAGNLKVETH